MARKNGYDDIDGFGEWEGSFRMRNRRHIHQYSRHEKEIAEKEIAEKGERHKRKPLRQRESVC